MALKTRGSATVDKAQRRLANLKSIDEQLDLGYGLTIAAYRQMIETTRAALDAHNILISNFEESRKTVTELEKDLAALSERMLTGVSTKYGRNSVQYSKAGGSNRKGGSRSTAPMPPSSLSVATVAAPDPASQHESAQGHNDASNGKTQVTSLN
jgi:hypothetical protein